MKPLSTTQQEQIKVLFENFDSVIISICRKYLDDNDKIQSVRNDIWLLISEYILRHENLSDVKNEKSFLAAVAKHHCLKILNKRRLESIDDYDTSVLDIISPYDDNVSSFEYYDALKVFNIEELQALHLYSMGFSKNKAIPLLMGKPDYYIRKVFNNIKRKIIRFFQFINLPYLYDASAETSLQMLTSPMFF